MALSENEIQEIRASLKRCSPETVEATLRFRESKNVSEVPAIVYGIIERYLATENARSLTDAPDTTSLVEDLGIDSLTMLEIVLSIEEAIGIRVENEELREITTLGEVKAFIAQKIAGGGTAKKGKDLSRRYNREEIALVVPQQPPFFFLDNATIEGDSVKADYHITGDEYFLEGHFRDNPVFPAAIVFEALGQAACLWLLECAGERTGLQISGEEVLFASLDGASFHRRAKPGDTLTFDVKLTRLRAPLGVFSGEVKVNGEKLAQIDRLVLAFGSEVVGHLEALEAGDQEAPEDSGDTKPDTDSAPMAVVKPELAEARA